jgi:periplasmic divalent cation tolerance protein
LHDFLRVATELDLCRHDDVSASVDVALALLSENNDCRRMSDEKLVISTAGSKEEASKIAGILVEERLAACVNIVGPMESVYRWQDKVERAQEFMMVAKTTSVRASDVVKRIRELHSYDLPEAVALDIEGGSADYLKWIAESVR